MVHLCNTISSDLGVLLVLVSSSEDTRSKHNHHIGSNMDGNHTYVNIRAFVVELWILAHYPPTASCSIHKNTTV